MLFSSLTMTTNSIMYDVGFSQQIPQVSIYVHWKGHQHSHVKGKNASATFWLFIWNLLFSISWGDSMKFFCYDRQGMSLIQFSRRLKLLKRLIPMINAPQNDYCYHSKLLLSLVTTLRCTVHSVYLDPISYLTCLLSILQHILKKTF